MVSIAVPPASCSVSVAVHPISYTTSSGLFGAPLRGRPTGRFLSWTIGTDGRSIDKLMVAASAGIVSSRIRRSSMSTRWSCIRLPTSCATRSKLEREYGSVPSTSDVAAASRDGP
jgi:hypothetical protein